MQFLISLRWKQFAFALLTGCIFSSVAWAAPAAAPAAVDHFSLDGAWQFRQTTSDPQAEKFLAGHSGPSDWHAATVPGVVQTDLLANKLIPDPFYRDNEAQLQWIGYANWEYQRSFHVSAEQLGQQHADLVFHGLDTFAKVFVNDQQVLSTDNQFRTWRVDVRPQLHTGTNTIRVLFESPLIAPLKEVQARKYNLPATINSEWAKPFGLFTLNYTRKAPYNYGWDWGPRFITSGIWRPAEIEFWNEARIDNVYVRQMDVSSASANLGVETDIVSSASKQVQVNLQYGRWTPPAADLPQGTPMARNVPATPVKASQTVWLHEGVNHVVFPVNMNHPALWYPTGYGPQDMYQFHIAVVEGASQIDQKEAHTGLRSVVLQRNADQWGRNFAFEVNGIPIFAKGANLIPFDSFPPRTTDEQMKSVLDSAVEAHMNMLRVWGGGYYGTDRFYELADERGLMLWQEFMFSDAVYPHDKAFFDNVQQEAIDQVRRLRNHPSIVLWCGNNEIESGWHDWKNFSEVINKMPPLRHDEEWGGYMHLFSGILPTIVAQYSPDTPYWPSSPSNNFTNPSLDNDQYGDAHYWSVWHGRAPFSTFNDQFPRFMSEYGFQSFPAMPTIDTFTEPGDRSLLSPVMLAHQKNREGNQLINLYMGWEFPQTKDFPSFVYVSQVLQAEGIKTAAEHLRRNRPHVMGSLYWQLNDCWPVASWSSVDYYGRWKALQYYTRRFYQDLLVSPHVRDGNVDVSVVSDRTSQLHGSVRVELLDFSGKVLSQQDIPVTIQPLSAVQVFTKPQKEFLQSADPGSVFLHTELRIDGENGGQPVSTNNFYFLPYKDLHLPAATVQARWTKVNGKTAVELSTRTLARDVYIEVVDLKMQPSDNFFDLIPGHKKTVVFASGTSSELKRNVRIISLSDAFAPASAATSETASTK